MDRTTPRLIFKALSDDNLSDPEKIQEFWISILRNHLPVNTLEEPRLTPLVTVINHAMNLGCRVVIIQNYVQDPDYTAEYHAYHGRIFSDIDRFCTRLHCFTHRCSTDDPLDAIDQANKQNYLGFITLRPIRSSPVGATILRPPLAESNFLLSKDHFDVHLAGRTFSVTGTPFMQQDNAVGACAQASIWMALRTLRKREGLAAHDPAEITSSATRFYVQGRTLPNRDGLVLSQMMEAVRSAGYSPTLLSFRDPPARPTTELLPKIRNSIYPYVESEIPVILVMHTRDLGGHAVVLIGHGWGSSAVCSPTIVRRGDKAYFVRNSVDWVSSFFIHNDNTGPYLSIPDTAPKDEYSIDKVCYAIPLLPADVFMVAEEAEQAAIRMISQFTPEFLDNKKYLVRTYLQERFRFREIALNGEMIDAAKRYYRLKRMPKRIWVTEINLQEGYDSAARGQATRVGEVVIDPTDEPTLAPFLSIHLPGILIDREPSTRDIKLIPLSDDKPYSPLVRLV